MNTVIERYSSSYMQQGMLFHSAYEQQPGCYIEQVVCSLREAIQTPILLQSWQHIVERHPVLRTGFSSDAATYRLDQTVYDQVKAHIDEHDWRDLTAVAQQEKLADYLQRDRHTAFDLALPPLMRLALFQYDEANYTLVWTFHHALLDGRSISLVLQEVFAVYDASLSNQSAVLPERRPYRDYIDWLQQQSFAAAEPFWREQLRGFMSPTQFPILHKSSVSELAIAQVDIPQYSWQHIQLSPELTTALHSLAQKHELTLNTLVQGAWAILLSHYSGDSDVVFGATRACRYSAIAAMESMVGLFINTLPVRTQIDADTQLLPWLKQLRAQWVTLRTYEQSPLTQVQEWSEVPTGTSLFNSILIFDPADLGETLRSLGDKWETRTVELLEQLHYPLVLNAYGGSALKLKIQYDRTQFDDAAISELLQHLSTLLQGFVINPDRRVIELPLVSSFSCFVVGEGSLPLSCLEILLQKGCQILGVYSTDHSLQEWAERHHIPHAASRSSFQEQLLAAEYDYLFSINNIQWIIPGTVLTQARKATINYHDSPLPKYAGLYATSWALIHGETQHAVTWHEVVPELDAGRILKQKTVPILAEDTVFDLNTRCYDAAVSSFTELVQELTLDCIQPYLQDLSQRSYFSAIQRPEAASLLTFDISSKELCNLVRALDFGPIRNQMGVPKIWLPGGVVVVGSAKEISGSQGQPGQVLQIDLDGMRVATADGVVQFSHFTTPDGREISPERLVNDYGVQVGAILPVLSPEIREAISQRNAAICRYEQEWVDRLMQLTPFSHPYLPVESSQPSNDALHRYPISLSCPSPEPKVLLAMFAAYCARLTPETDFDLGLQTASQRSIAPEIFAQRVPLRVQMQTEESFSQFKERFEAALNQACRSQSFRHTLLRRYLELRDRLQSHFLPVAIVVAASRDQLDWSHLDAVLAFVVYEDGSQPELIHAGAINAAYSELMVQQLQTVISACLEQPECSIRQLPLLSEAARQTLLTEWNQTAQPVPKFCIHELFEQQVARTPNAIALAFEHRQLTYAELNTQANQLAHYLRLQGVGPDGLVGVYMERSLDLLIGLLAIHKAGGAYLPLDPDFPAERLRFMVQDSQTPLILTQQRLVANLAIPSDTRMIPIDTLKDAIAQQPTTTPESGVTPAHLSYVIYTSGSTGKPKGVMVEHRNVVNFFTGMDAVIDREPPAVWLAVTSLSFDISVLELFWTLTRGFKVVIYSAKTERAQAIAPTTTRQNATQSIDFSLFYFSSHEQGEDAAAKYRLMLEGARFGDEHHFKAVWTPERHFHAFGGLFPNPAITSAAIATTTKQIQIRAGSCVLPLHDSIRIAEDWAVIDNLSSGRVGISFATGWQPNDFALRPEAFQNRKQIMFEQIEEVQTLWQGGSVTYPNGNGKPIQIQTLPRPIQPKLPIWITAAGNPETFQMAGAKGFHLLTHLLGQSLEELAEKIALYRQAWTDHGHAGQGTVTLMLHTFVGESDAAVKEIVRQPMRQYLSSSLDLIKQAAWSFPTFKQKTTNDAGLFSMSHLSEQDRDEVLDFSFERYFATSGLFGTVETCLQMVDRVKAIGVNEIACLIDYGVETELVLSQLPLLNQVRIQSNPELTHQQGYSLAELIQQHQVTHLQCTPSMASLLAADTTTRAAIAAIRTLMVGGEAFTEALALQLKELLPGQIHNMYGPTETTIWSATHTLTEVNGVVPIGRAIANTELYVLDELQQPVPIGVGGELYIGGQGVTRGYLNRSELTQERFVPNPFSADPSARLYRTGDLVRYRPDGCLEFLGRIDFQVKVRGYRIELGEIETVLSRHEAVREAAIVVREDEAGEKRLVAYLLAAAGDYPSSLALREYLLTQLPEYMVPSNFVWLEAFPLTPNHKVDRKALTQLAATQGDGKFEQTEVDDVTTHNPTEKTLMEIWRQVLQLPVVQTTDNFFDLGGNSLIAVSLIANIRDAFNVDLPLISLFQAPTIAAIAQRIDNHQLEQVDADELTTMLDYLERISDEEVLALLNQ